MSNGDPFHGFNFRVEIDRTTVAGFREASGLSFSAEVVEYREGSEPTLHPRKLAGLRKFGNITLKRGLTRDTVLWDWYRSVLNGAPDRRNGTIILQDENHADVLRWHFTNGWPTKLDGPSLNATSNEIAIESIDIAVER